MPRALLAGSGPAPDRTGRGSERAPAHEAVLALQRTAGNGATSALLCAPSPVQRAAEAAATLADPTLRIGSRGEAVRILQDHLVQAGAAVDVDGAFGPITRSAVVAFQRSGGLAADGVVGPRTWAALKAGTTTVPVPAAAGAFTAAGLTDKVVARLQGLAAKLRPLARPPSALGAASHGGGASVLGLGQLGFAPTGASHGPDAGGVTGPANGTDSPAVAGDLGAIAPAAGEVIGLLGQPQVATALGGVAADVAGIVGPLAAGAVDVPLDQVVVQLNTVTANVGQAVANEAGAATATGSTTVTVAKDSTYKITGATIGEVGQALDAHMAIHGEAAHVAQIQPDPTKPANDSTNPKGPHMSVVTNGAGKVVSATVIVNLERVLPEWTKASSTSCACWRAEWDRFDKAIRAHEQEHVNKEVSFFTGLHLKVVGMTEEKAFATFDKVVEDLDAAQRGFDEKTKHGQDPAPGTAFNAGKSCTC